MITYFTHTSNRIAVQLAIICFCLGSILFLLFLITDTMFIWLDVIFFILYLMSNFIMTLVILVKILINHKDFQEHFTALVILLLNVPIAMLYISLLTITL